MWSAEQVANWLLIRHSSSMLRDEAEDEYITQMKLHKLLYYAQGVYMALFNKRLFNEEMLAWQHGPVVRSIYDKYQGQRELGTGEFDDSQMNNFEKMNEDQQVQMVLEAVYEHYGKYSAGQLRNMTHKETPWLNAWSSGQGQSSINDDEVRAYFKEHVVEI